MIRGAFRRLPDCSRSRNRKKLSACAHAVEMWSKLWMKAEKMAERNRVKFFSAEPRGGGPPGEPGYFEVQVISKSKLFRTPVISKSSYFELQCFFRTGVRADESSFAASRTIPRNARTSALNGRCRGWITSRLRRKGSASRSFTVVSL